MITLSPFLSRFRIGAVALVLPGLISCAKDVTSADPGAQSVDRFASPVPSQHAPQFRFAPLRYDFIGNDTSVAAAVIRVLLTEGQPQESAALRTSIMRGADIRVLNSPARAEAVQAILRRPQ